MASIRRRAQYYPALELKGAWMDPSEIMSILMIVGGNLVQKALAQLAGGARCVPICFSFGWVNFAFTMLLAVVGDGKLMPAPDYPCKIINVNTGYTRENRSWLVGRLLRDDERPLRDNAMSVSIYDATARQQGVPVERRRGPGRATIVGWAVILIQLTLAAVPIVLDRDWAIFLITAIGTALALLTGTLPQWKAEKFACRTGTKKCVALTRGNGSRHVMLVRGNYRGLDLEDLSAGESPRTGRQWSRYGLATVKCRDESGRIIMVDGSGKASKDGAWAKKRAVLIGDTPVDFYLTCVASLALALCWVALLVQITGLTHNAWFLAIIGALGLAQNITIAGIRRSPTTHGVNLRLVERITGPLVLDVLMDLERLSPRAGKALMKEFFPNGMDEERGQRLRWMSDRIVVDTDPSEPHEGEQRNGGKERETATETV
ncbi:MAG: hypothetical protein M1832_000657 [Thelocarpon impressellum]|nr:MAG: hypothetical protein M1832_000657 [Thelocarpon impressellum]